MGSAGDRRRRGGSARRRRGWGVVRFPTRDGQGDVRLPRRESATLAGGEAATYGVTVEGDVVGLATLEPDWERRTGNLALWLAPAERGREYAQEVGDLLVDVVFDDLDLDLVAVHHDVGADTARRALEKFLERNGGRFEARIRNAVNRGGELVDQRRYTLSRAEYRDE
ncbi:GNAT family N-acetyltransferase [Halospeciosus flavus]|uniref:GNAT family N-acetyltransferase n=1 Tax=Halospeciosus flavus TaxID=3032283 RepID=UPI00360EAB17